LPHTLRLTCEKLDDQHHRCDTYTIKEAAEAMGVGKSIADK